MKDLELPGENRQREPCQFRTPPILNESRCACLRGIQVQTQITRLGHGPHKSPEPPSILALPSTPTQQATMGLSVYHLRFKGEKGCSVSKTNSEMVNTRANMASHATS